MGKLVQLLKVGAGESERMASRAGPAGAQEQKLARKVELERLLQKYLNVPPPAAVMPRQRISLPLAPVKACKNTVYHSNVAVVAGRRAALSPANPLQQYSC